MNIRDVRFVDWLWSRWAKMTTPWPRRYVLIMIECDTFGDGLLIPEEIKLLRKYADYLEATPSAGAEYGFNYIPGTSFYRSTTFKFNVISDHARWHQRLAAYFTRHIIKLGAIK